MQGLLSDAMPQDPNMAPEGGMSDVDMAVEDAMMGGGMDDMGFGVEMASEEEEQQLRTIMDTIEEQMHGKMSDSVTGMLENAPDPATGISFASHIMVVGSFTSAVRQDMFPSPDVYLGENGVIQETVELVYEVADAMGKTGENPDETLSAAYLDTLRRVGETLLGSEDPRIRESAQEMLAEYELGMPVNPSDYAEEGEVPMDAQGMGMGQQMAQGAPQSASQAPLPPMAPQQGMI